jgi:uncharacterized protein YPO0396
MPNPEPEFLNSEATPNRGLPGFRLERLEIWNWGTFNGDVQVLESLGGWALLIGDNGSGKSTAIDALRTLLVPPRLLNYNDASVDGRRVGRDRTRRSYVRGAWASSSLIDSTSPTTQYLRESGVLSAVAAVFTDSHLQVSITLAQVLWEHEEQVRELYAIARTRRTLLDLIKEHTNTSEIKRAAQKSGWHVDDSFAAYAERMRPLLHIPGDKALEVFNRAIGMKEVTDIDAFVRQFMLPSADTFAFIRDTVQPHYRTLLDCWAAIERAERQILLLRPIAEYSSKIGISESHIQAWKRLQESAPPYFAARHLELLRAQEVDLTTSIQSTEAVRAQFASALEDLRRERDNVNSAITATGVGPRLKAIESELAFTENARKLAQQRRDRIQPRAQLLGATSALNDAVAFVAARTGWEEREKSESTFASEAETDAATHRYNQERALADRSEKLEELESVERHRVNIPRDFLSVRQRVAQQIGVSPDVIPFAGELMEVRPSYTEWTGAIERLLRGFGLSLLIPEHLYRSAAEFINSTSLGLRLIFHRVPSRGFSPPNVSNDRVPGRLQFRTEHPLHVWVVGELVRRFNHRCCASIAELEATERGLTREGLVRDGTRHVKDDARSVNDPGARILGWTTDQKIAALRQQIADAEERARAEVQATQKAMTAATSARDRANAAHELLSISEYSEIDPQGWSDKLLHLRQEKAILLQGSEQLRSLQQRLGEINNLISTRENELSQRDQELGGLRDRLERCQELSRDKSAQLARFADYDDAKTQHDFTEIVANLTSITLQNADQLAHAAHQSLQGKINYEQSKINQASDRMTADMGEFLRDFPEFRQTLEVGRAFAESFSSVLRRIEEEDLPRHRERFEHYLNENLVGDLLMLNRRLEEHMEVIDTRIQEINRALQEIDYAEGTYVQLRLANHQVAAVAEFRRALRGCFEYGIAPGPEERLQVFSRVRELLEQFQRDPEGTQRSTDVRTWFIAGVRELRRSDDSEVNYYAATTGKSGGQKAKLAFTILASALSAQYGLTTAQDDASNFRLVVIDEAFSRTDEGNSTRAMQLFARLGFQLLIVGPFDAKAKLAVPFVQTIHLASNPVGDNSRLIALTREEVETALYEQNSAGTSARSAVSSK